jgi:GTP-binding protein HflX
VFNKVDKVDNEHVLPALRRHFPDSVFISVQTGQGMDELIERISEFVARGTMTVELRIPAARSDLLARLHREATVRDLRYEHDFTYLLATVPTRSLEVFGPFLAEPGAEIDAKTPVSLP